MRIYIIRDHHVAIAAKRPTKLKKGDLVIAAPEDLAAARLPAKRLMAIWNALPGAKRIAKVTNRAALLEGLWAALAALPTENDATGKTATAATKPPRASKQAQIVALLRRPTGATLDDLVAATGWQRHTVRGAIAGALKKKLGLAILSEKDPAGSRVYRISA